MNVLEIHKLFNAAGVDAPVIDTALFRLADWRMRPVTLAGKKVTWKAWLDALPSELVTYAEVLGKIRKLPRHIENAFDCDNHVTGSMNHAATGNARRRLEEGDDPAGLAAGGIWFESIPHEPWPVRGRHAVEWFVDKQGRLRFFEPAAGEETPLWKQEIKSITFIWQV